MCIRDRLDVGAIAKGYAVEKVAQKLEKAGLKHAIINGGGNVRLIGAKPDEMCIRDSHCCLKKDNLSVKIDYLIVTFMVSP